jgi:hypothetical protein
MNIQDVIHLADGNIGAATFLVELVRDNHYETLSRLREYELKGKFLWSLYKDLCDERIHLVVQLVKTCPKDKLIIACMSSDRNGKKALVQQYFVEPK